MQNIVIVFYGCQYSFSLKLCHFYFLFQCLVFVDRFLTMFHRYNRK